ncbi:MAG: glycine cleavage system protein GcvH [Candidatus Eisenbacteria bacterium]|nr:glycine cleavage system protein GcvH [Candidatus Eisenbacteria bacterium]
MAKLLFTKSHEWVRVEDDVATIGVSDYAQSELGDIVFVELPDTGKSVSSGDVLTSIESVKSVSELYTPVSGEIIEVNTALDDDPGKINEDPTGDGWVLRIKLSDPSELDGLMGPEDYEAHTKG